jgi:hypothetical protein
MTQRTRKMKIQKPLFETSIVKDVMAGEAVDRFGLEDGFDADCTVEQQSRKVSYVDELMTT